MIRRAGGRQRRDNGGIAIEAAILVPSIVFFVLLAVAAGRIQTTGGAMDEAARAAARSASLARDAGTAQQAAQTAAADALAQGGVNCGGMQQVNVDLSRFAPALGQTGYVTVTVECQVPLSDLVVPGLPGSTPPMRSTFTSVVDSYRAR